MSPQTILLVFLSMCYRKLNFSTTSRSEISTIFKPPLLKFPTVYSQLLELGAGRREDGNCITPKLSELIWMGMEHEVAILVRRSRRSWGPCCRSYRCSCRLNLSIEGQRTPDLDLCGFKP